MSHNRNETTYITQLKIEAFLFSEKSKWTQFVQNFNNSQIPAAERTALYKKVYGQTRRWGIVTAKAIEALKAKSSPTEQDKRDLAALESISEELERRSNLLKKITPNKKIEDQTIEVLIAKLEALALKVKVNPQENLFAHEYAFYGAAIEELHADIALILDNSPEWKGIHTRLADKAEKLLYTPFRQAVQSTIFDQTFKFDQAETAINKAKNIPTLASLDVNFAALARKDVDAHEAERKLVAISAAAGDDLARFEAEANHASAAASTAAHKDEPSQAKPASNVAATSSTARKENTQDAASAPSVKTVNPLVKAGQDQIATLQAKINTLIKKSESLLNDTPANIKAAAQRHITSLKESQGKLDQLREIIPEIVGNSSSESDIEDFMAIFNDQTKSHQTNIDILEKMIAFNSQAASLHATIAAKLTEINKAPQNNLSDNIKSLSSQLTSLQIKLAQVTSSPNAITEEQIRALDQLKADYEKIINSKKPANSTPAEPAKNESEKDSKKSLLDKLNALSAKKQSTVESLINSLNKIDEAVAALKSKLNLSENDTALKGLSIEIRKEREEVTNKDEELTIFINRLTEEAKKPDVNVTALNTQFVQAQEKINEGLEVLSARVAARAKELNEKLSSFTTSFSPSDLVKKIDGHISKLEKLKASLKKHQNIKLPDPERSALSVAQLKEAVERSLQLLLPPPATNVPDHLKNIHAELSKIKTGLDTTGNSTRSLQQQLIIQQSALLKALEEEANKQTTQLNQDKKFIEGLIAKPRVSQPITPEDIQSQKEIEKHLMALESAERNPETLQKQLNSLPTASAVRNHATQLLGELNKFKKMLEYNYPDHADIAKKLGEYINYLDTATRSKTAKKELDALIEKMNAELTSLITQYSKEDVTNDVVAHYHAQGRQVNPEGIKTFLEAFKSAAQDFVEHLNTQKNSTVAFGNVQVEKISITSPETYETTFNKELAKAAVHAPVQYASLASANNAIPMEMDSNTILKKKVVLNNNEEISWIEGRGSQNNFRSDVTGVPSHCNPTIFFAEHQLPMDNKKYHLSASEVDKMFAYMRKNNQPITKENLAKQLRSMQLYDVNDPTAKSIKVPNAFSLANALYDKYINNMTQTIGKHRFPTNDLLQLAILQTINYVRQVGNEAMYLQGAQDKYTAEAYVYVANLLGITIINHSLHKVDEIEFNQKGKAEMLHNHLSQNSDLKDLYAEAIKELNREKKVINFANPHP